MDEHSYLFSDEVTGEDFIVKSCTMQGARQKIAGIFEKPVCYGIISDAEAEMMGLDTY